jgi:hypothetical protein
MAKLTLSVDEAVVERAKKFARRRGTSVSALVEGYLDALARPGGARTGEGTERAPLPPLPPVTARLAGLLRGAKADRESYRRYLGEKFR